MVQELPLSPVQSLIPSLFVWSFSKLRAKYSHLSRLLWDLILKQIKHTAYFRSQWSSQSQFALIYSRQSTIQWSESRIYRISLISDIQRACEWCAVRVHERRWRLPFYRFHSITVESIMVTPVQCIPRDCSYRYDCLPVDELDQDSKKLFMHFHRVTIEKNNLEDIIRK